MCNYTEIIEPRHSHYGESKMDREMADGQGWQVSFSGIVTWPTADTLVVNHHL